MTRARRGWLSGLAVGVTAGFATLEIPSLGWLLIVAFAVPAALVGPRLASLGGLLVGIGGIWIVLLGRMALTCQATGDELGCHAPDLEPWFTAGTAMLLIGLLLTGVAAIRSRRATAESHQP
jgi:hypothetical protein